MEAFVVTWRELLIVVIAVLAIYVVELLLLLRWFGPVWFPALAVGSQGWRGV